MDIVAKLRGPLALDEAEELALFREAADEIESLRAVVGAAVDWWKTAGFHGCANSKTQPLYDAIRAYQARTVDERSE